MIPPKKMIINKEIKFNFFQNFSVKKPIINALIGQLRINPALALKKILNPPLPPDRTGKPAEIRIKNNNNDKHPLFEPIMLPASIDPIDCAVIGTLTIGIINGGKKAKVTVMDVKSAIKTMSLIFMINLNISKS